MTSFLYEFDAAVRDGDQWQPLPVVSIVPSVDLDRVPYTAATLTLGAVSDTIWALLDPRTINPRDGGNVRWRLRQYSSDGDLLGWLPRVGDDADQWASMHVRTVQRDLRGVVVTLHGAESMVDDRLLLEDRNTYGSYRITVKLQQARTLGEYVNIVLGMTFGAGEAPPADEIAQAAVRVPTLPTYAHPRAMDVSVPPALGSSLLQLVEAELSSVGCRLIDQWGLGWLVIDRDHPPAFEGSSDIVRWASHDEDLAEGVEPVIIGFTETVTRDGDWADTVVVTGQTSDPDYTVSWQHNAEGGARSRGRIIPMDSPEPSANLAASIASRAFKRGHDITITARITFDVTPGASLEVHLRSGVLAAEVVSIEWNVSVGEMTVHARSAQSLTVESDSRSATELVTAPAALRQATQLADKAYLAAVAEIPAPNEALGRAMELLS